MGAIVVVIGCFTGLFPYDLGLGWAGSLLSIIPLTFTIFFGAIIYACIGLILAARTDMTNAFLWSNLINMPLVFVSGAIIPIDAFETVAPGLRFALLCNPTTWMADSMRVFLGGQIGTSGTANIIFGTATPTSIQLIAGWGLDIAVLTVFGIILFFLAFRVFGGSLQESSGGMTGVIHKKTAEAREKMFKDLDPADRKIMMNVTNKIDMLKMGQIMQLAGEGKQDVAVKMLKDAGISDADIQDFFAAGMRMMQKMMEKQKK
jgi:hypothetical protein